MTDLPDDLAELERRLAESAEPAPPALRTRVLSGVRRELRRGASHFISRHGWRLAGAAAGVLLALNVALSAMNYAATWNGTPREDPAGGEREARAGLPEDEIGLRRLLVRAGARLTPAPDLGRLSGRLFFAQEARRWDTP
jgi:hypothetical protein